MPVLPKYQLKALWEAGDLITQYSSFELIEACYNDTLVAGANITLTSVTTPSGTTITISSTGGGGGGTVQSASNIGSGEGVFAQLLGTDLQFKSLVGGSNVSITSSATEITISSTDTNTTYDLSVPNATTDINLGGSDGTNDPITITGGSDISVTRVSGTELSIAYTGEAACYIAGDGIELIDVTGQTCQTIAVDLAPGCGPYGPNLGFDTNGDLDFLGVHIQDEGIAVGTFPVINFTGVDVYAEADGTDDCVVNVYIPPPAFSPYFNQASSTKCLVTALPFATPRISTPTGEGNPYETGGGANPLWAATNNKAAYTDSGAGQLIFTTAGDCTGFGGDSKIEVTIFDGDGVSVIETFTTPSITGNNSYTNANGTITVNITAYAAEATKWKAIPDFEINAGTELTLFGRDGGRFHVQITHFTDSASDGTGPYYYYGPNGTWPASNAGYVADDQDVFFDFDGLGGNPSEPVIDGTTTIVESSNPAEIETKHLSGVEYYILGSKFEVDVTDINKFNANTQGRGGGTATNLHAVGGNYGLPPLYATAWNNSIGTFTGTNWPDLWDASNVDWEYNDWDITATFFRFRNTDAFVTASVYDPWAGPDDQDSPGMPILVDTYPETGNSTKLREKFDDEEFRIVRGSAAYQGWNTVTALQTSLLYETSPTGSTSFSSACTVGSCIVPAQKFFKDDGNLPLTASLTGSLASYKPDLGGTNPDYSAFTQTANYHRLFESISTPGTTDAIASFELVFSGDCSFPGGNALAALTNEDMKIYVRKHSNGAIPASTNLGYAAVPYSLHGAVTLNSNFGGGVGDVPTGIDAADGSAQIRTINTVPGGNTITGSFASYDAEVGFYVEIQLWDDSIRIDEITCNLVFADGNVENG